MTSPQQHPLCMSIEPSRRDAMCQLAFGHSGNHRAVYPAVGGGIMTSEWSVTWRRVKHRINDALQWEVEVESGLVDQSA